MIELAEATAEDGQMAEGLPRAFRVRNTGTTLLRDLDISTDSDRVQLATSHAGPWMPSVRAADMIGPGGEATFIARATFERDDLEQTLAFEFHFDAVSVGE